MIANPQFASGTAGQPLSAGAQVMSLWDFFSTVFVPLNRLELPLKELHKGCCDLLQKAVMGQLGKPFIIVNIPPRVGKTKIMEALCCWQLAFFPDSQIIYTSYAADLAVTSSRYIQQVMKSEWYKDLFETRLGTVQKADEFLTTQGGKLFADGVGGALTGKGAGLKRIAGGFIIIDDPAKPDEALSKVEGDKLRFWFENTLKSRRNSSEYVPIIICAQRLADDDLPGFVMTNYPGEYELVKFQALVNGQSTIPETISTKELLATQRVNPYAFNAQYQQEPTIMGGNLIKTENWKHYDVTKPPKFIQKIITCDTAWRAKEHNDYCVLQTWGKTIDKRAFLIDQVRGRWTPGELLVNALAFWRKHNRSGSPLNFIAVEEAQAGIMLIQDLRKKGIPAKGIIRITDKVSRVKGILAFQETGMVYIPRADQCPWVVQFEHECAAFREDGKSTHDDMVDCFADGVGILLGKPTSILAALGRPRTPGGQLATPAIPDGARHVNDPPPLPVPKLSPMARVFFPAPAAGTTAQEWEDAANELYNRCTDNEKLRVRTLAGITNAAEDCV